MTASYFTAEELRARLSSQYVLLLADSGDIVDAAIEAEIIGAANGEVNGYLAERYAVPVDLTAHPEVSAVLKGFSLDIGVYRCCLRRPPMPSDYKDAYDRAVSWLKDVAAGTVTLPAATPPDPSPADGPVAGWGSQCQNAARLREL